jgi:pyruvate formate lyase activating enzyme
VAPFLDVVDLFIADIKLFDSQLHKKHTGSSNELIMENFHYLASHGVPMRARIPLIPEVTATDENVRAIARFVHRTRGDIPVELINFNPLAVQKYRVLGRTYQYTQYQKPFPDDTINHFTDIVEEEGLEVVKE